MLIVGRALTFQPDMAGVGDVLDEHLHQARFANPRLTRQEHHLAHALGDVRPAFGEEGHVLRPPHQGRQAVESGDGQATLHPAGAQHVIHLQGRRQVNERVGAQGLAAEIPRGELLRSGRDHQRVGRGQGGEPQRNIGRLPQGQRLVARPHPDIVHHHQARMHAQAHRQRLARRQRRVGRACSESVQQGQPGPDGALGVIFMRHRIAKIHQHAVAQVLRDIAVKPLHHLGTDLVVGMQHLAVLFRVWTCRQGHGARQVAAEHGEVASFGRRG